ncbi:hypothetical protein P879_11197 [Paragonimus westermani]|uniref:Uncharacterized protein n=1 Tax=Paragonimus westermani TaxID=34504 RepID=A0A8T0D744_9TREM|nr:hypothetical protein P879_11197 [Paragonimus westermani]
MSAKSPRVSPALSPSRTCGVRADSPLELSDTLLTWLGYPITDDLFTSISHSSASPYTEMMFPIASNPFHIHACAPRQAKSTAVPSPPWKRLPHSTDNSKHIRLYIIGSRAPPNGSTRLQIRMGRFTIEPIVVPLNGVLTQSIAHNVADYWIHNFSTSAAITSDRGCEFN